MAAPNNDNYLVGSLDRGLDALLSFMQSPEMSFTDFAEATGSSKATAKRVLYTLEKNGFLEFNHLKNTYHLGVRTYELGIAAKDNLVLLDIARPHMESICNKINETVLLAQKIGHEQVYLDKIEGIGTVRLATLTGRRRPLYYGLGKTILAFMPEEEQFHCLPETIPAFSLKTIARRGNFMEDLKQIHQQGYAIDEEEYIEGVVGIGSPIFNCMQGICGLIGVVGPNYRMTDEKREIVIELVKKVASTISLKFKE